MTMFVRCCTLTVCTATDMSAEHSIVYVVGVTDDVGVTYASRLVDVLLHVYV